MWKYIGISVCVVLVPLLGFYAVWLMAKANVLWTVVESGWCRIILKWGEYQRTVGPGLRWVGLPGICSLYSRRMKFLKSITDRNGKAVAEVHDDRNITSFKTTRYPYALPFIEEEDCHALPLSGLLSVFATVEDYNKAFFTKSDWYSEMNNRILKVWRELLVTIAYDDDIVGRSTPQAQARKRVGERLWEALTETPSTGGLSVIDQLFEDVGVQVHEVGLVSVDPPEGWRATTLAPYKAEREQEAAKHTAATSAIQFGDTELALTAWIQSQTSLGHKPTRPEIAAKQRELRERALAKTPGYQQLDIRGLENATTAMVGGGGAGMLMGGGGQGGGKGDKSDRKRSRDMNHEELLAEVARRRGAAQD